MLHVFCQISMSSWQFIVPGGFILPLPPVPVMKLLSPGSKPLHPASAPWCWSWGSSEDTFALSAGRSCHGEMTGRQERDPGLLPGPLLIAPAMAGCSVAAGSSFQPFSHPQNCPLRHQRQVIQHSLPRDRWRHRVPPPSSSHSLFPTLWVLVACVYHLWALGVLFSFFSARSCLFDQFPVLNYLLK